MADTFTAITEDRPYRPGMDQNGALAVLDKLAAGGGLDGEVVQTLRNDFDAIDTIRRQEQTAYGVKQAVLARVTRRPEHPSMTASESEPATCGETGSLP